jgi:hypothetical protein
MPEYCTCGTKLVEDARFCHRCGRPTWEDPTVETAPPPAPPQPSLQTKLQQLPVNFSNPVALRVALLMAVATVPVEMVFGVLFVVWWLAAGWCAVLLYQRLTGSVLSVNAGARLGTITGVLTFLGCAIGFTILIAVSGKQFFDEMAKQNPNVSKIVNDPPELFAFLVFMLVIFCVLAIGCCAAGGALGAKFARRRSNRA